jgi:hypothetical protein
MMRLQSHEMNADKEIALKSEIKRQVRKKEWENEKGVHALDCLIEMWRILATDDAERWRTTLEEQIWRYIDEYSFSIKINSSYLGLKTVIKDYINAKGETKPSHFTQRGCYYGSIKTYGLEPVFYDGYFEINKNNFTISLDNLCNLRKIENADGATHYPLSGIFVPKKIVE